MMLRVFGRAIAGQQMRMAYQPKMMYAARGFHSSISRLDLRALEFPAMSPTMTEGNIATWKKSEGDTVETGEPILDVETDKATIDVEATDDLVLVKILKPDGTKDIQVNTPIAIVAEPDDDISPEKVSEFEKTLSSGSSKKPAEKSEEAPEKAAESSSKDSGSSSASQPKEKKAPSDADAGLSATDKILGTPAAKRLALERGIALKDIKGTGPGGRIVQADIEKFQKTTGAGSAGSAGSAAPAAAYTDEPLSNMRKTIGSRLLQSHTDIPSYSVTVEVNMDRLIQLRKFFNDAASTAKVPYKLSVNDFILKASALASKQVPALNSSWTGDAIRTYNTQDISVAVSTPTGLITPIVRDVGSKGLIAISNETKELAKKAREGKLKPEEYQGGTFSVSNLGMFNVDQFTAIINPPQSAILAIGGTSEKLVADKTSERGFKVSQVMKVTLVADHRVTDGAVNAQWLQAFRSFLESPLSFML